jgi:hypothetical protein
MKKVAVTGLVVAMVLGFLTIDVSARPNYKKAWDKKYVEGNENEGFVKAAEEAKCNVCHQGKSKKMRNDYGTALSKMLMKEKDDGKIMEAFAKAEEMKGKGGETFGALIKDGKLPGTEIDQ